MEYIEGEKITIPAGTEINGGVHEDGESFFVTHDTIAFVVRGMSDGAIGIQIEGFDRILFYHQPVVPPSSKEQVNSV